MGVDAITVNNVSKTFRIFRERNQSLKHTIVRRRRMRFDEFNAVDGLDFSVQAGTSFGLIGGNGAGKSTTLKVLAQILQPDEGTVTLRGRVSAMLELGAGFHPDLSGRENIFLNGSILGLKHKILRSRLEEIIEFAGLQRFIDNPVKTYSSGMYARLGFAVAVNVDPDILLIDEVLAVGDEAFQRACRERIAEMRAEGRTVVLVSHGLGQVQTLCDQALWLDKGKLQAIGPAPEIVNAYVSSVHARTETDATGRVHSGTGEARITDARFFDRFGQIVEHPLIGSPIELRIEIQTTAPIVSPVIGFWIMRSDGLAVAGTRTQHVFDIAKLEVGTTVFAFRMPSFGLLPERYHLGVAISDDTVSHIYDHCERFRSFEAVPTGSAQFQMGVVTLVGEWSNLGPGQIDD